MNTIVCEAVSACRNAGSLPLPKRKSLNSSNGARDTSVTLLLNESVVSQLNIFQLYIIIASVPFMR